MRYRRVLKPNASTGITTFKYTRILFICEIFQPKTWLKLPLPREILSRCHPIQLPQHTHTHRHTVMEKTEQRIKREVTGKRWGEKNYIVTVQDDTQNEKPPITFRDQSTEDFNSSISYSIDFWVWKYTDWMIWVIYLFWWFNELK